MEIVNLIVVWNIQSMCTDSKKMLTLFIYDAGDAILTVKNPPYLRSFFCNETRSLDLKVNAVGSRLRLAPIYL